MKFLWNQYQSSLNFSPVAKEKWIDEFFFCLLGGYGVKYELNKSAFLILKEKGYFNKENDWEDILGISQGITNELLKKQFTLDYSKGKLRAYRFPYSKGDIIAKAGNWLKVMCNFHLDELFLKESNSKQNRLCLISCPGFGLKSASWLLRNIGMGNDLAILDIHVYRTLQELRLIPEEFFIPKNYLEIEDSYCNICRIINAKTEAMDLIIWTWARQGRHETSRYPL
ncbi:MAG: hypothetical protein ABFD00_06080 [Chloroherpetonaceae bacterium]